MRCYATIVVCTAAAYHFASNAASAAAVSHRHHQHHGSAFLHTSVRQKHSKHSQTLEDLVHTELRRKRHRRHHNFITSVSNRNAAHAEAGGTSLRPIITGCLKECGYEEQTCVTQCQVCMEQNECRILGKCDPCLREAHAERLRTAKIDKGIMDSGGVAMVRDGLLAEMTRARLEALDKSRNLRIARSGVLKAQREAEWAAEERHMSAKSLRETRQVLKGARVEVTRWKLQNEKKLKAMRAKAREQRQERQAAKQDLEAAKSKYSKAQRRLRIASSNATETEPGSAESTEDDDEVDSLAAEVEERQEAVEGAERDVEKTSADGEWLDRGLRREVKGAQTGARKAREELLEARARERVSRERLEEAKVHYVSAVKASQFAEKAAHESEQKLREAPLSAHTAPEGAAKDKNASALHNSAWHLTGGASLPFILLLVSGLAGM